MLTGGELDITHDLRIDGDSNNDGRQVTISGNDKSRIFSINGAGAQAGVEDLTLTDGYVPGKRGGAVFLGAGAGLAITGSDLTNSTSSAVYYGGGRGGAVYAAKNSRLTVADSRITGNLAKYGGGIDAAQGS